MDIDSMIEVLQAIKAGEKVQRMKFLGPSCLALDQVWSDFDGKSPNFQHHIFRVKPKLMEVYVNVYKSVDKVEYSSAHKSKESAKKHVCGNAETVKFIEVIE